MATLFIFIIVPVCFPIVSAVYIAEMSLPALRGSLLNYKPVLISFGMFLTYVKGKYLHWRTIPYIISAYASAALLLSRYIPESEVWLTAQSEKEFDCDKKRRFDAFRKPTFYKPMFIITGFFLFQNLAGTNVTILNLVSFFHDFGTDYDPYSVSIYVGLSKFLINLINTWLMIKFKRRSLITFSFFGMALAIGASATSTMLDIVTYQWISPMMLVAYTIFTNLGVMFMPYLVSSELCPKSIRASAQSISFAISQFAIFASFQFYYWAKTYAASWHIQYFFGVMSFAGLFYAYYFLPETHNKTLTEIEDGFCDVSKKNEAS
ncbi:hypothetical protein FQR65_LT13338 [Abscondita terminalis]|nr:hypothetical protein FQR65_LT13338 [Abscondita terminalis]